MADNINHNISARSAISGNFDRINNIGSDTLNLYLQVMPKSIDSISAPAILIEKSILEKNLLAMQKLTDKSGVKLRVHVKTHKIPELAKMQIRLGACGIAVAKLGEAEVMADSGIKDIQIANIITGPDKIKRLVRLNRKLKLTVAVDSIENARELSNRFHRQTSPLNLLIKINSGLNRCGLDSFDALLAFLKESKKLQGIRIVGLMTHAGHAYGSGSLSEIRKIGQAEGQLLVDYARRLKDYGYDVPIISVGSTPTAPFCAGVKGVTELRVGNYIFNDMTQVSLGIAKTKQCALSVLSTVISMPSRKRVILDTGSKALALDKGAHGSNILHGHGLIKETGDIITRLSEEHGIIDNPRGKYKIGDRLRIIPNHACTVMNLFDEAYLVNSGKVIRKYKIAARGKMS